jgi:hypothetical protein
MGSWSWTTFGLFVVVLTLSSLFLREYDKYRPYRGNIWLILGLILGFCLLGFRAETVGKDLAHYSVHIANYNYASISEYGVFSEPLMNILEGIAGHFGGIHAFIILSAFVEYLLIYIALKTLHNKSYNVTVVYATYFSFIVIRSISMVSNGLGIACAFCAIVNIIGYRRRKLEKNDEIEKNNMSSMFKYFVFTLLGIGFHNSIWLNFPIYFLCRPIKKEDKHRRLYNAGKILIVMLLAIFFYMYSRGTFNIFISSIANGSYIKFASNDTSNLGIGNILIRLPFTVLVFYSLPRIRRVYGEELEPFKYLLVFDLLVAQLKYLSQDLERLTMITGISIVIYMGILYDVYKNKGKGIIRIVMPVIMLFYMAYYLYRWGVQANYGIMPYVFW